MQSIAFQNLKQFRADTFGRTEVRCLESRSPPSLKDGLKSAAGAKKSAFADSILFQPTVAMHPNPRRRVFQFQTRTSVRLSQPVNSRGGLSRLRTRAGGFSNSRRGLQSVVPPTIRKIHASPSFRLFIQWKNWRLSVWNVS